MRIGELLRWQWEGYPRYHQSRVNLLIHIVAVPLFLIGTVGLIVGIVQFSIAVVGIAIGCIIVAIAAQGRGRRLEPVPPEPSSGPANFVARVFFEHLRMTHV